MRRAFVALLRRARGANVARTRLAARSRDGPSDVAATTRRARRSIPRPRSGSARNGTIGCKWTVLDLAGRGRDCDAHRGAPRSTGARVRVVARCHGRPRHRHRVLRERRPSCGVRCPDPPASAPCRSTGDRDGGRPEQPPVCIHGVLVAERAHRHCRCGSCGPREDGKAWSARGHEGCRQRRLSSGAATHPEPHLGAVRKSRPGESRCCTVRRCQRPHCDPGDPPRRRARVESRGAGSLQQGACGLSRRAWRLTDVRDLAALNKGSIEASPPPRGGSDCLTQGLARAARTGQSTIAA